MSKAQSIAALAEGSGISVRTHFARAWANSQDPSRQTFVQTEAPPLAVYSGSERIAGRSSDAHSVARGRTRQHR
jgi:hypothetical protein